MYGATAHQTTTYSYSQDLSGSHPFLFLFRDCSFSLDTHRHLIKEQKNQIAHCTLSLNPAAYSMLEPIPEAMRTPEPSR